MSDFSALVDEFYFDPAIGSLVIKENDLWIVSVTPMIFNDRVLLTYRREYPTAYVSGWCYDKGGGAVLAAIAWDPDTEFRPVGFKKEAVDRRNGGVGPHVLVANNGERALCGGPGVCAYCDPIGEA